MATIQEKYFKHIMKDPIFTQFPEVRGRMMHLPVCPNCERPALRDKRPYDTQYKGTEIVTCPACAYHGPAHHTVKYHLEEYVPAQGRKV